MTEPRYTVLVRVHGTDGTDLHIYREVPKLEVRHALVQCLDEVDRAWRTRSWREEKEAGRV
jgi:hypothetical protein